MASSSQALISAQTCSPILFNHIFPQNVTVAAKSYKKLRFASFTVRAATDDPADCNTEECAPDKEVGKVSMDWLAKEKTKVSGTFPPRTRGYTGYVEKDTAGQTNIYSVEPAVYIAESAISSGAPGSSSSGAENTAAIAGGIALVAIAAASSILLQVGKNTPQVQPVEYSGPSLSYYISKFKASEIIEVSAPVQTENAPSVETETAPSVQSESSPTEAPQIQVESEYQNEPSTSSASNDS